MRVAITMRVVQSVGYKDDRDAISHDWISYLDKLKLIPILIPNVLDDPVAYLEKQGADALILSNGNDVGLCNHDNDLTSSDVSPERDKTESKLLKHAMGKKIPVLGVCRGMQFINVFFRGGLRKIELKTNNKNGHVNCTHQVEIIDEHFNVLTGDSMDVNSFHNFGINESNLSQDLRVFAINEDDGFCEGLYHPDLPILGMQWHPERSNPAFKEDLQLIENFFNNGAFWSKQI
jgi:putative glutamine amidotransferase